MKPARSRSAQTASRRTTADALFRAARTLPRKKRAELAYRLLESLDDGPELTPREWAAVWGSEIERRIVDSERPGARARSWSAVLADIRRRQASRRA